MQPVYVHKAALGWLQNDLFGLFSSNEIFRFNVSVVKLPSHDPNDTKKSTCEFNITCGGHLMNSEDTNWKYAFFSAE